jgi:hypothetical protein
MSQSPDSRPIISDKPYPVPIEMRPLWRMCLLVASIAVVSGENKYLDIKKVNILVWMLIRRARWAEYEEFLFGRSRDVPLISVDTATYKAVEFAVAKDFLSLDSGRLYLTANSEQLFGILEGHQIMAEEIGFLTKNGKKLTEYKVNEFTGKLL